jgi:hypothetical protein
MTKPEENISKLYDEMVLLKPTPEEMVAFIEHYQNPYGVVTYSTYDKKRGGNSYFISVHDNHKGHKHYHIDLGFVDFNYRENNVLHLMLDKIWAESFIDFIKEHRVKEN